MCTPPYYDNCGPLSQAEKIAAIVLIAIFGFCCVCVCIVNVIMSITEGGEETSQNADLVQFRAQGRQQGETSEERTAVVKRCL